MKLDNKFNRQKNSSICLLVIGSDKVANRKFIFLDDSHFCLARQRSTVYEGAIYLKLSTN